jgi:hypothetical protein
LLLILVLGLFAGASLSSAAHAAQASTNAIQMVNVTAELQKTIDAKKSKAGDPVTARISADATLSNGTRVPADSILTGHIDSITPSENKSDSTLIFTFDKLAIKNAKEIPIKAVVVRVASFSSSFGQELATGSEENGSDKSSATTANSGSGMNGQGGGSKGPHLIEGLNLTGSPNDPTSATLTQTKKNIHLTGSTQLIVSIAALP